MGMLTLSNFLEFWGFVFLATTMFVCFFKPEVEEEVEDEPSGLVDTYKQVRRTSALSWVAAAKGCPTFLG